MKILPLLLLIVNLAYGQSEYPKIEIRNNYDTLMIMTLQQAITLDLYTNDINFRLNECLDNGKVRDSLFIGEYNLLNKKIIHNTMVIDSLTLEYQATINELLMVNNANRRYLSLNNSLTHNLEVCEIKVNRLEDENLKANRNAGFAVFWGVITTTFIIFNFFAN
jgi:hypothetical protein